MKKWVTLILGLSPLLAFSQKITVSEPITLRSDIAYDLIGGLGGRTLLFRDKNTSFEVVAFDQRMQETWSKELELDPRQPKPIGVVGRKMDFVLLYQFRMRSHTLVKAHKYGPGANLLDSVAIMDLGTLFYSPNFVFERSEDRSKGLIYYIEKQDLIKAFAFDLDNMKLLWETALQLEDFNAFQNFRQVIVDNEGNMTMILEQDNYRSKRDAHLFEAYTFYGQSRELLKYDLPMNGRLTYDVKFTFDNVNGLLVGGGLYSDKNLGRADGFFYLSVDPYSPEHYRLAFSEFDEDFVASVMGKEADRAKGVSEVEVTDIVLRMDGGILLVNERNRTFERRTANMSRTFYDVNGRFAVDYYYDEVFVISIHPNGEAHWKTVLHKKQYSQDDSGMYSSYFLFRTPTSLRFLFNDEIKYENTVSEYVLKGNGDYERNSLMSTENLKLRLRFRDALQVSNSELIVPSERRNRLRLVKLEF
ncbi:MAG: hypothetical protein KDC66_02250 [Phaeodactylibacter sp.]|nr:hypothetical protein [Phaeodactylibacter sp.]MCB9272616.1 hypothetical protein [Lewinellaceae bacterium]